MSHPTHEHLPEDGFAGLLVGRAWLPAPLSGPVAGPSPVWIRSDGVFDLSSRAATTAELFAADTGWLQQGTAEQNIYLTGSIGKAAEVFPSNALINRSNEVDLIDVAKQFVTVVKRGELTASVGANAIQFLLASAIQEEIASKCLSANSLGG